MSLHILSPNPPPPLQSPCIQMIDFNSCHISYEPMDSYLTSDKGLVIRPSLRSLKDKGLIGEL